MLEDGIEREILIAAPVERVWSVVSEPGFWATDSDQHGAVVTEGDSFVARHSQHGDFPMRVEKVDPPTYLAYRWTSAFPGEALDDANSTLVEFTLVAEGAATRLRVVETGFDSLTTTDSNRGNIVKDHRAGWEQCLAAVAARAA